MKAKEADILIISDETGADEDHWHSRWERQLSTARCIIQANRKENVHKDQVEQVVNEVKKAEKPIVFIAYSLGVPIVIEALASIRQKVCGVFFVAPPDMPIPGMNSDYARAFAPYTREPLPFPSLLIASRNDPFCSFEKAEALAKDWRSLFLDAGEAGHIDSKSGHGPWPEGLMVFSQFLAKL